MQYHCALRELLELVIKWGKHKITAVCSFGGYILPGLQIKALQSWRTVWMGWGVQKAQWSNALGFYFKDSYAALLTSQDFPGSSVSKESPAGQETRVQSLGGEDPVEKEMATHWLQYSCLENPMDRGAWWATVHGVTRVRHNLVTKPSPPLALVPAVNFGFTNVWLPPLSAINTVDSWTRCIWTVQVKFFSIMKTRYYMIHSWLNLQTWNHITRVTT